MFSYRHIFHAGNHADVFKHVVLIGLLNALQKKEKAYGVLDTHAGIGKYDLSSPQAAKNAEFENGISRLWQNRQNAPEIVEKYLSIIEEVNPNRNLQFYPGSPMLIRKFAREEDLMIACEYHKADFDILKQNFLKDRQAAIHYQNGYQAMKAFLPPKTNRGLVLIDPAYDSREEVYYIVEAMKAAIKKWPIGVYAIWYPILNRPIGVRLQKKLLGLGVEKVLDVQFAIKNKPDLYKMTGSGMLIINCPWQFEEELKIVLPWLHAKLCHGKEGFWRIETGISG